MVSSLQGLVPDGFIYLHATPETCLRRLTSRCARDAPWHASSLLLLARCACLWELSSALHGKGLACCTSLTASGVLSSSSEQPHCRDAHYGVL